MRRVFLWAARNRWLKEHLPRLGFMRRAVRRFMPGETMDDALTAAAPLQAAGIGTLYTRLGENLESLAEADDVVAHYLELIDRIKAAGIDGEISVKPTQLGLDHDADACLAHLVRLAGHAEAIGSYLWIDMEGSAYTDATIEIYERLRATQPATGICLQAYLRRTAADIERLLPARSRDPPGQGRLRRAGGDRLSRQARGRRQLRRARRPLPARRPGPADPAGPRDARRRADRADRGERRPGRRRARRLRDRDALRHPDRPSSSGWRRRAIGSSAHRVRRRTGIRGTCAAWRSGRRT